MSGNPDSDVPQVVTPEDIRPYLSEVHDLSWEIDYHGAQCKFELSSDEDSVLYDLSVPSHLEGRGIGTSMVRVAEETIKSRSNAKVLYAQVGASGGRTKHVLSSKCGFEIIGVDEREELGTVVDAQKRLKS